MRSYSTRLELPYLVRSVSPSKQKIRPWKAKEVMLSLPLIN